MGTHRLSSGNYLFWMSLGAVIWSFSVQQICDLVVLRQTLDFQTARYLVIALDAAYASLYAFLTPPRLRDIGFPNWLTKFSPLLLITVILAPLMLFYRGDSWDNQYGPAPEKPPLWLIILGFILFLMAVGMSYKAMLSYM